MTLTSKLPLGLFKDLNFVNTHIGFQLAFGISTLTCLQHFLRPHPLEPNPSRQSRLLPLSVMSILILSRGCHLLAGLFCIQNPTSIGKVSGVFVNFTFFKGASTFSWIIFLSCLVTKDISKNTCFFMKDFKVLSTYTSSCIHSPSIRDHPSILESCILDCFYNLNFYLQDVEPPLQHIFHDHKCSFEVF